jgi:hypothetical protein
MEVEEKVHGKEYIILMDMGTAGTNLISINFITYNIPRCRYNKPVDINTATKGSKSTSHEYVEIKVQFNHGLKIITRFDICPLNGRETVLGMLFLQETKAIQNPSGRTVRLQEPAEQLIKCTMKPSYTIQSAATLIQLEL